MGRFKDIAIELNLNNEQIKNKSIQKFVLQVAWRQNLDKFTQILLPNNKYLEILKNFEINYDTGKLEYTYLITDLNKDNVKTETKIVLFNINESSIAESKIVEKESDTSG